MLSTASLGSVEENTNSAVRDLRGSSDNRSRLELRIDLEKLIAEEGGDGRLATYVWEAYFFFLILEKTIDCEAPQRILEVGGGIGLLSTLMAGKGPDVVCVEPGSAGFLDLMEMNPLVAGFRQLKEPDFFRGYLHELPADQKNFDFVICVNVLEHVPDYMSLIAQALERCSPSGYARFICPNYAFPYEPHFNIPTLWNKNLTGKIFAKLIASGKSGISDPVEMWSDLS